MSLVEDVRVISRTSPSTCRKIRYSSRSDTLGSCPTGDHRCSGPQVRLLALYRVDELVNVAVKGYCVPWAASRVRPGQSGICGVGPGT
jgi:hypothetical protein